MLLVSNVKGKSNFMVYESLVGQNEYAARDVPTIAVV